MTKKQVLWVGLVGVVGFFLVFTLVQKSGCREDLFFFCRDSYLWIILILKYLFPIIFLLSLITYKMKDIVFQTWFKFARVWVPLTIILVILSPEYGNALLPVEKGTVSFFMSALFLIISLIIIVYKSFQNSKSRS